MTEIEGVSDLPLLGQSLALDAVNSRYGVGLEVVDFLDDAWIDHWVDGLSAIHQLPASAFERAAAPRVRAVRDAARTIVYAAIDGSRPPAPAISVVNDAAGTAPTVLALAWDRSGPARDARETGTTGAPLAGRLALATIELVTGPDALRVRRCARPGCSMLFVQQHGHRRFCHPSCSHMMRQDRYRHRQPGAQ